MTATTTERNTARACNLPVEFISRGIGAQKVLAGTIAIQGSDGYAYMGGTSGQTLGVKPLGIFESTVDNSLGAAGALAAPIRKGTFWFANSTSTDALTAVDIESVCFIADNQTVARTSSDGTRAIAGVVKAIDSSLGVAVEIGVESLSDNSIMRAVAAADLSGKQYYAVKLTATGFNVTGLGEAADGILQNAPTAGQIAIVKTAGESTMIGGGSLATIGTLIASTSAGKAKAAVLESSGGTGSAIIGRQLTVCSGDNAQFQVFINSMGSVDATGALS